MGDLREYATAIKPDHYDPDALCKCGHKRGSHAYTWAEHTPNPGAPSEYDGECAVCEGTDAEEGDEIPDEPCEKFEADALLHERKGAVPAPVPPVLSGAMRESVKIDVMVALRQFPECRPREMSIAITALDAVLRALAAVPSASTERPPWKCAQPGVPPDIIAHDQRRCACYRTTEPAITTEENRTNG